MAQVILTKNLFVGHRIRKSPDGKTPVFVPDEYLHLVGPDSVVISEGERSEHLGNGWDVGEEVEEVEEKEPELADFDTERTGEQAALQRIEDVSVAIITSNAQKLLKQNNINPQDVRGSGKGGRITQQDVLGYIERNL